MGILERKAISFRLDTDTLVLLDAFAHKQGITRTDALKMIVRRAAKAEGLTQVDVLAGTAPNSFRDTLLKAQLHDKKGGAK